MAAFRLALDMNADMVELDVQLSKDGELVVIHDDTVDRTTDGTGRVADLTLAELRKLDAGCRFQEGGRYAGEAIPLLTEVLELCRGKAGVLIELKWPELHQGLEQALAEQLQASGMCGPEHHIIVQSFDEESVKRFRSLLPEIPVGLLVEDESELTAEKLTETAAFADYVNPYLGFASKSLVEAVHAAGLRIFCWTVRTREAVQPLLDAGVDGIITDNPDYIAES
ncbi:glycerophosphodiester phosphodiesterase [Paenibacillus thalictri]|uniref:Glycerophosphodiester phosphodiesterase n=2 Tax=Paenibacillus thalictri TaxID=2527873 RepID=A0A4Q9DRZ3_9BACL|nr:glycerophosphodiester phosphodiesterase [Paenibacillus thalictri]